MSLHDTPSDGQAQTDAGSRVRGCVHDGKDRRCGAIRLGDAEPLIRNLDQSFVFFLVRGQSEPCRHWVST